MNFNYLTCCLLFSAWNCHGFPFEANNRHLLNLKDTTNQGCEFLDLKDVKFLEKGTILITAYNTTMSPTRSYIMVDNIKICFNRSKELKAEILAECQLWAYDQDEFDLLGNGSVILQSPIPKMLEPGTYEIVKRSLHTCTGNDDYDDYSSLIPEISMTHRRQRHISVMLGKVGCSISIAALIAHLIIFCMVPPLRNLPGYNLASLSIAFLLAFLSTVIGQIPSVLGLSCKVSGILQLNFFLVAFFCMNVMAFDVWRTLRMATLKLVVSSDKKKKIQLIFYTIYSWGIPLLITSIAVVMDNMEDVPAWLKPEIGKHMVCWLTNKDAKIVFFSVPAFTLFMVNGVFFILSAVIIKNNTMKNASAQQNQSLRRNFILYVRLGFMMGVTWLISVLATVANNNIVWLISDFLNPLQGFFIFLLFTCSPKVVKYVKQRFGLATPKTSTTTDKKARSSYDKQMTNSSTLATRETAF